MSCSGLKTEQLTTRPPKNGTFRRRSWQGTTSGTEEGVREPALLERSTLGSRSQGLISDLYREPRRSRTSRACRRIISLTCIMCTPRMAWRALRRIGRFRPGPGRGTAVQERAERTPRGAQAPQAEKVARSRTRVGIFQAQTGHSRRTATTRWTHRPRCSQKRAAWSRVDPTCPLHVLPRAGLFSKGVVSRLLHRTRLCSWGRSASARVVNL
mmetsp:Transcript_38339/g.80935  ORF Transcript_38339/g.80935 Transcript_38339/m.80935 type:complete len:212 (+) Transcript_38339:1013-1648(+)